MNREMARELIKDIDNGTQGTYYRDGVKMQTVAEQARTLSSGTIASIAHETRYQAIDMIQWGFVQYCERYPDRYTVWQEAWSDYVQTGRLAMVQATAQARILNS